MSPQFDYKKVLKQCSGALFFVALAMIVRDNFLDSLGGRLTWLTFYPAVMVAALYGGFWTGMLATGASCFGAVYMWDIYSHQPFIKDSGDWLGAAVFFMNGLMIAGMAEMSRRSKARAVKALGEAEAANRAKSVFLATMSHELRTPLNAILGFSELMRHDQSMNDEQRGAFGIINKSGVHLLNLINDILDMARVESGKILLEQAPCDVSALARDVVEMMRQRAEAKGLSLHLELSSNVPHTLSIDEAKVRQVLINLAGNAIKFTSSGQVCIKVAYGSRNNKNMLLFEVSDTGTGIPEADLSRIFKPFEQVGQSRSTREGTGLGLAISNQYTNLMGGVLAVESRPGHGSTFRFEVPAEAVEAKSPDSSVATGNVTGIEPGQPEWRILIVEDEPANWLLLKRVLGQIGLEVRVAENGADGVAVFQEWAPHFIWMDCRMPVMDGLEATRRIRGMAEGTDVKIVALTASVFKEEHDSIMEAGMDGFMQKPFDFSAIYACLEDQLGMKLVREIEDVNVTTTNKSGVDPDAVKRLDSRNRLSLTHALKNLDQEDIQAEIARIAETEPELADSLGRLAENLRYTEMLKVLKASE